MNSKTQVLYFNEELDSSTVFRLLSHSLPYYLNSWHDLGPEYGIFGNVNPASFNMAHVESSSPVIEYVIRPHVQCLCILASYLYADSFDIAHGIITRDEGATLLQKGIAWACATHLCGNHDVEGFLKRKRWGENWRSSLWTAQLALAAFLSKEVIAPDLFDQVLDILAFEADRFINVRPPNGCEIDTKLEENAQDTLVLAWAVNLLPNHPNYKDWECALRKFSLNTASTVLDKGDHTEYYGSSVAKETSTTTLFPDMTAENHGFFQPGILTYGMWVVLSMAAYSMAEKEPPEFLRRKHHQDTHDVLLRFCLPTGMIYEPGGHDLPMFIPRPFALAWGLWNNDPRALRMTSRLLSWMEGLVTTNPKKTGQWVLGFEPVYEGWELLYQSQVGFELAMLAILPFQKEFRFYSSGQIESAVDTRRIYPYVQVCYRRNTRTTRSVAWKALGNHPLINLSVHDNPELIASCKASLLGIPSVRNEVKQSEVAFHQDRFIKDGFDTYGRIIYRDRSGAKLLRRDVRVLSWGDEGILVFDQIVAEQNLFFNEQYLSPLYLVNDHWSGYKLSFNSGSLRETFVQSDTKHREVSCPAFWASVENNLLFQFVWGRTKGLIYLPGGERNAPPYWQNCRLDMLAVRVESQEATKGDILYQVGFYVGTGKSPRPFKAAGSASEFFKGLVIMDGKNTIGLD